MLSPFLDEGSKGSPAHMFELIKEVEDLFETMCGNVVASSALTFKKQVSTLLEAYLKQGVVADLGKNAEQLRMHAAALPHEVPERSSMIKMADFAEHCMDAGGSQNIDQNFQVSFCKEENERTNYSSVCHNCQ